MNGVIDVDIGAWSRIWRFYFLVTRSVITATKRCMNCFFRHNFVLDIILLIFLVVVLAGTGVLRKCLPSVWRFALVLPKFSSLSFR